MVHSITLATGESDVETNTVLGRLNYAAPGEAQTGDARLIGASITAVAEGDFTTGANATKLVFSTGASETAAEKMSLSSVGLLTVSGRVLVDDTTNATSTTDGSLQTDGGLSVALDCIFGNDVKLLTDSSVFAMGVDSDFTITHDGSTGATIATGATGLAINTDTITVSSANTTDPVMILKNTNTDANAARLRFVKEDNGEFTAGGRDDDDLGVIEFYGEDSSENEHVFAKILAEISESQHTDEAGKLSLFVAESDGTTTALTAGLVLEGEHATDGEVDVTIAAGASSTTTVAGNLTVVGTDVLLSAANSKVTFGDCAIHEDSTSGWLTLDATNIELDASNGAWYLTESNTERLSFKETNSGDITIQLTTDGKDLIFTDHGDAEGFRILDAAAGVKVPGKLYFYDEGGEYISSDGSTLAVTGATTFSSTVGVTGVVTANAGVVVDNITIDGTEIDLSSGDLTIDVAADIDLDAGGGNFKFSVGGTQILDIGNSSSDVVIKPVVDAKDIIFQQRDGTEVARIEDDTYLSIAVGIRADAQDGASLGADGYEFSDLWLADGAICYFGDDGDVTLTHVADTGLRLNSTRQIQFNDANEAIYSSGSSLVLKANNVAYTLPTADAGGSGYSLTSNGSGTLSWTNVSGGSGGSGDVEAGSDFSTNGVIMAANGTSKTIDVPGTTLTTNGQAMTVSAATSTPFIANAGARDGNVSFEFIGGTGATNHNATLKIIGNTGGNSYLYMGDPDDHSIGYIRYKNTDDSMILHVNDANAVTINSSQKVTVANDINVPGEVQTTGIGYTDGDNSMTIADGGKVTFANGFAVGSDAAGDILYHNGTKYVRLAKGSDGQVLTLMSGIPSWQDSSGGMP